MSLAEAPGSAPTAWDDLDREAMDVAWAVDRARRNPWFGGDVLGPEFRTALSSIVARRPLHYGSDFVPGPAWRGHRNRWRDALK